LLQLGDLLGPDTGVLDLEDLDLLVLGDDVLVDADDRLTSRVDAGLGAWGGLLDAALGYALPDRLRHAAGLLDRQQVVPGLVSGLRGEPLDIVRARPRVHRAHRARLLLEQELRVPGDPCRE